MRKILYKKLDSGRRRRDERRKKYNPSSLNLVIWSFQYYVIFDLSQHFMSSDETFRLFPSLKNIFFFEILNVFFCITRHVSDDLLGLRNLEKCSKCISIQINELDGLQLLLLRYVKYYKNTCYFVDEYT